MTHYLIRYDRSKGRLESIEDFVDPSQARDRRFALELEYAGSPDIEIIVLSAESEADVRRTHGRFFQTLGQLAMQLEAKIHAPNHRRKSA